MFLENNFTTMNKSILSFSDRKQMTREEFLKELEEAEKDWEKNGGLTLEEFKKKYKL